MTRARVQEGHVGVRRADALVRRLDLQRLVVLGCYGLGGESVREASTFAVRLSLRLDVRVVGLDRLGLEYVQLGVEAFELALENRSTEINRMNQKGAKADKMAPLDGWLTRISSGSISTRLSSPPASSNSAFPTRWLG